MYDYVKSSDTQDNDLVTIHFIRDERRESK